MLKLDTMVEKVASSFIMNKTQIMKNVKYIWFIFNQDELLLQKIDHCFSLPINFNAEYLCPNDSTYHVIGEYDSSTYLTIGINRDAMLELPPHYQFVPIREAYNYLPNDIFQLAGSALEILHWNNTTRYCGQCGAKTKHDCVQRVKICTDCHLSIFPQISPAILALIWRDDEILLARSEYFKPDIYSILAGYVEFGESIEQAMQREVKEEVGITIKNICYYASQPWPFPCNLMLGLSAEYDSGNLSKDNHELEDAAWFSLNNLPLLPGKMSLSRQMIDVHLHERKKKNEY